MTIATQLLKLEKDVLDALDGVQAEQISTTAKLDDLDYQLGELREMLGQVLELLEPEEE